MLELIFFHGWRLFLHKAVCVLLALSRFLSSSTGGDYFTLNGFFLDNTCVCSQGISVLSPVHGFSYGTQQ